MLVSITPIGTPHFRLSRLCSCILLIVSLVLVDACGGSLSAVLSPLKPSAPTPTTPISILTHSLPSAKTGNPYSALLTATGGVSPYSWMISSGILPNGVKLASSTGALLGITDQTGEFVFRVTATDSQKVSADASLSLLALSNNPTSPPTLSIISPQMLPPANVGNLYSSSLTATGGIVPYSWSISWGVLPEGIELDASTGLLSGTANQSGTFTFQATVTDSRKSAADASLVLKVLEITIASPIPLSPTCSGSPSNYFPVQQITCTNPNLGQSIMCVALDGSIPSSNGHGSSCMGSSWALSPVASNGIPYSGYFSINRSATVNIIAGVNGQADSAVASYAVTAPAQAITPYNFGMQCGPSTTENNCPVANGVVRWPTSIATPELFRIHDSGQAWSSIEPECAEYSGSLCTSPNYHWTKFDAELDAVADHSEIGMVQMLSPPCWTQASCNVADPVYPNGGTAPPTDLGKGPMGSSPNFDDFVAVWVNHVSPVADNIKILQLWNEWDLCQHWTGTAQQLYDLLAYPVRLIRAAIPGIIITTPSEQYEGTNCQNNYFADLTTWLKLENTKGRISDFVDWHGYLRLTNSTTNIPEVQWAIYQSNYLSAQAAIAGWNMAPFLNSETNFTGNGYVCPSAQYTEADCAGQVVRWQILHDSNGAVSLDIYYWNSTIGQAPGSTSNGYYGFSTPSYYAQQYLTGGYFTATAGLTSGTTWTAPFIESNGTVALWVWSTSESGSPYTVPSGYSDYRDLSGRFSAITGGQTIAIGVEPILLEQ
jgi:hypothetical protein